MRSRPCHSLTMIRGFRHRRRLKNDCLFVSHRAMQKMSAVSRFSLDCAQRWADYIASYVIPTVLLQNVAPPDLHAADGSRRVSCGVSSCLHGGKVHLRCGGPASIIRRDRLNLTSLPNHHATRQSTGCPTPAPSPVSARWPRCRRPSPCCRRSLRRLLCGFRQRSSSGAGQPSRTTALPDPSDCFLSGAALRLQSECGPRGALWIK